MGRLVWACVALSFAGRRRTSSATWAPHPESGALLGAYNLTNVGGGGGGGGGGSYSYSYSYSYGAGGVDPTVACLEEGCYTLLASAPALGAAPRKVSTTRGQKVRKGSRLS